MRFNPNPLLLAAGVFIASLSWMNMSSVAYAETTQVNAPECDITGTVNTTACNFSTGGGAILNTAATLGITDSACASTPGCYDGVRSDPGQAVAPIYVWGACRYVDNNSSGTSVFVPFRTAPEWTAFYSHATANNSFLSIPDCSVPFPANNPSIAVPWPPYANDGCSASPAVPPTVATPQIYYRYYNASSFGKWPSNPYSLSFTTCNGSTTNIGATADWYGLPAEVTLASPAQTSWTLVTSYGPYFSLVASATIPMNNTFVSGSQIKVLSGTQVTLTWKALSSAGSSSTTVTTTLPNNTTAQTNETLNTSAVGSVSASWQPTGLPTSGSATFRPTTTTTYSMTGTGVSNTPSNGLKTVVAATVVVEQPITVNFGASPTTINSGGSSTLTWSISNPSQAPITCTATGGWSGGQSATGGSVVVSPRQNATYILTCSDSVQSVSQSASIIVCQAGYLDWNGQCTLETYTAGYGGESCPTACSTPASVLAPTSCTRNPDGAQVALSYCSGESQGCVATAACAKPCTTVITSSLTRPQISEPITVDYTMTGGGGGAAGPGQGRGGSGGTTAIVVNGNVVASAPGGGGAVDGEGFVGGATGTNGASGASTSGSFTLNPNDVLNIYVGGGGGAGPDMGTADSAGGGGGAGWPGGAGGNGAPGGYGYGGNGSNATATGAVGGAGGNGGSGGAGGSGASTRGDGYWGGAGGGGGGGYGGGGGGAGCSDDPYAGIGTGYNGGNGGSTGNQGGVGGAYGGTDCVGGAGGGGGASGGGGGRAWGYGGNGGLVTLTYLAAQCL